MLTHGSLFSGIGGFDLGFARAGIQTLWQVERDEYARRVLERHFPEAQRHEDIRRVGPDDLCAVEALTGGFPCQDVSGAGKRRGIVGGTRSSLWREILRVADFLRPRYIVLENVA